MSDIDIFI